MAVMLYLEIAYFDM